MCSIKRSFAQLGVDAAGEYALYCIQGGVGGLVSLAIREGVNCFDGIANLTGQNFCGPCRFYLNHAELESTEINASLHTVAQPGQNPIIQREIHE